jgi:uncharacterized protein YjbI with pentapeptide repeats
LADLPQTAAPWEKEQGPIARSCDRSVRYPPLSMKSLSASDLLRAYSQGERNFQHHDLSELSLFEAMLANIDLSGSRLVRAYIPYANLNQANLTGADLATIELSDAQLYQAQLCQAQLPQANLSRVNLRRANLQGANLRGANLQGADLRGADLSQADLSDADLSRANLETANLRSTCLAGTNFFRAKNVNFTGTHPDDRTVYPDGYRDQP